MGQRYEFYLNLNQKEEIYCQVWKSSFEAPLGTILVTHGLSEHSDCYHEWAKILSSWGWDVLAWDLIGHGRSSGRRGFVEGFDDFLVHQKFVIDWSLREGLSSLSENKVRKKKEILILFSHSLGGLISLKNLLMDEDLKVDALLLSSPCLGLSLKPPKIKVYFSKIANKIFPRLTLNNEILYENLSRDKKMIDSYKSDPLRHDRISAPLFLGMVESMAWVKNQAHRLRLPLLFQVSENDQITDSKEASLFYNQVGSSFKKFFNYPESHHEIYNDLDREKVFKDLKSFLLDFLKLKENS